MNDQEERISDGKPLGTSLRQATGRALRSACSFPAMLGLLLAAASFVATGWEKTFVIKLFQEGDTWFHVAVGEQILATRHWPTTDHYSFSAAGQPWIADQWLGGVVMAIAARLDSLRGLATLLALLSATLVLLIYYYAWLRGKNAKAAAIASALVLPIVGPFFSLRPQLLGFIFLVITLILLERYRQGMKGGLWLLPGVFLLWVNAHGSFVFGPLALGLYVVCGLVELRRPYVQSKRWTPEQRRQLLIVSLLCVLALVVTPYGAGMATFPFEVVFSSRDIFTEISVWYAVPDLNLPVVKIFALLLALFFLAQVLFAPLIYRLDELALLLLFTFESIIHVRFLPLFGLSVAPLLAALLARWVPRYEPGKDRYVLNAALMVVIALGIVKLFPSQGELTERLAENYPQGGVDFLRQHPDMDPTFNEYKWGGYLIWSGRTVFIDGERPLQLYDRAGVFRDYLLIVNLNRNVPVLLRKYGVRACLIERDDPLGLFLGMLPDWQRVYRDELSEIYVRKGPSSLPPHPSSTSTSEMRR